MKQQDKLKKLAEMAGVEVKWVDCFDWEDPSFMIQEDGVDVHYWRPLEDMNQALAVWRKMGWRLVNGFPEF